MYVGNQQAMGDQRQRLGNAAGPVGAIGSNPQPERRPELAEYSERMAMVVAYTEELVAMLEKRLSMVSAPGAPASENACQTGPGPVTYYGQQLAAGIERIAVVNEHLCNMLERLEA